MLKPSSLVTTINLDSKRIGDGGVKAVAKALQNENCQVTSIELGSNHIGVVGAKALAEALIHEHCRITSLNIMGNRIGAEGVQALSAALQHEHCQVTSMNLMGNRISDSGAKELAQAFEHKNCKVTSIDLSWTNIGDDGAKVLAEALEHENCQLTSINLSDNRISDTGAKALVEALEHGHCKVTSLDIRSLRSSVSESLLADINAQLKVNKTKNDQRLVVPTASDSFRMNHLPTDQQNHQAMVDLNDKRMSSRINLNGSSVVDILSLIERFQQDLVISDDDANHSENDRRDIDDILRNQQSKGYYRRVQFSLNEIFTICSMISSDSETVSGTVLSALSEMTSAPFAKTVLSFDSANDTSDDCSIQIQLMKLSYLNPNQDAVSARIFVERIARRLTRMNEREILQCRYQSMKLKSYLAAIRRGKKKADDNVALGVNGEELSESEKLANHHSKKLIDHIITQETTTLRQLSELISCGRHDDAVDELVRNIFGSVKMVPGAPTASKADSISSPKRVKILGRAASYTRTRSNSTDGTITQLSEESTQQSDDVARHANSRMEQHIAQQSSEYEQLMKRVATMDRKPSLPSTAYDPSVGDDTLFFSSQIEALDGQPDGGSTTLTLYTRKESIDGQSFQDLELVDKSAESLVKEEVRSPSSLPKHRKGCFERFQSFFRCSS